MLYTVLLLWGVKSDMNCHLVFAICNRRPSVYMELIILGIFFAFTLGKNRHIRNPVVGLCMRSCEG